MLIVTCISYSACKAIAANFRQSSIMNCLIRRESVAVNLRQCHPRWRIGSYTHGGRACTIQAGRDSLVKQAFKSDEQFNIEQITVWNDEVIFYVESAHRIKTINTVMWNFQHMSFYVETLHHYIKVRSIYWGKFAQGQIQTLPTWDIACNDLYL